MILAAKIEFIKINKSNLIFFARFIDRYFEKINRTPVEWKRKKWNGQKKILMRSINSNIDVDSSAIYHFISNIEQNY